MYDYNTFTVETSQAVDGYWVNGMFLAREALNKHHNPKFPDRGGEALNSVCYHVFPGFLIVILLLNPGIGGPQPSL